MSNEFIVGQRWISNSDPELGLGIITAVEERRVVIGFPACGEERTYAIANAPLSRIQYQVGDRIQDQEHGELVVSAVDSLGGCLLYRAHDDAGNEYPVMEQLLCAHSQLSSPKERLLAGQVEHLRRYELRAATLQQRGEYQRGLARGLLGARAQLLPHQLYIAHEVANRPRPRALLADEVGLGKTIEAGLVLHQLLLLERARRVLILVPDSLLHQWLVEMLRRFNLSFTLLDAERCAALRESGSDNPFESAQLVLSSINWLSEDDEAREQAVAAGWDLLIVDEAHHLDWQEGEAASPGYALVETLAANTEGLLLLTATPEQLGAEGHFARLRLLDPERYPSLSAFTAEQQRYEPINTLIQQLRADDARQQLQGGSLADELTKYLPAASLEALQRADGDDAAWNAAVHRASRELLDRFGTGRSLFRNTRASVNGFTERRLQPHPLPAPEGYLSACADSTLEQQLRPELLLGETWLSSDPRVAWLEQWLKANRGEKVLLICASADTAQELETYLRLYRGVATTVFHEHLSLVERDRAAAYFSDAEFGAQLLVCSEIGSEGRNFQFARHLILFDLPLNPDLLEQRIGRLDRIGQQHPVNIHLPHYEGSAQAGLLRWYHEALDAFSAPCSVGYSLYQQYGNALREACCQPAGAAMEQLLTDARNSAEQLRAERSRGRDALLELNSCDDERAATLVEAVRGEQRSDDLAHYLERVADQFGLEHEHHSEQAVILRPGDHMFCESFPGLPEDGLTGTFDRNLALRREDMAYLSWEHPLLRGAIELVLSGEFGAATICTLSVRGLAPGTLLLEALYGVTAAAPAWLQLPRYLSQHSLRLLLDSKHRELAQKVSFDQLNQLCQGVKKHLAPRLLREVRAQLVPMLSEIDQLARAQLADIAAATGDNYRRQRSDERARLAALAEVNPAVGEEALTHFDHCTATGLEYLGKLQLNMAGLRLAITT